jgi:hypothetical protein
LAALTGDASLETAGAKTGELGGVQRPSEVTQVVGAAAEVTRAQRDEAEAVGAVDVRAAVRVVVPPAAVAVAVAPTAAGPAAGSDGLVVELLLLELELERC